MVIFFMILFSVVLIMAVVADGIIYRIRCEPTASPSWRIENPVVEHGKASTQSLIIIGPPFVVFSVFFMIWFVST